MICGLVMKPMKCSTLFVDSFIRVPGDGFVATAPRPWIKECRLATLYLYLVKSGNHFFKVGKSTLSAMIDRICLLVCQLEAPL